MQTKKTIKICGTQCSCKEDYLLPTKKIIIILSFMYYSSSSSIPQAGLWRGLTHVLMDADDYRASDILQYEDVNVLRELNKARLGFSQDLPPPPKPAQTPAQFPAQVPGAASSSSRSSDIISVSRQASMGSGSPG